MPSIWRRRLSVAIAMWIGLSSASFVVAQTGTQTALTMSTNSGPLQSGGAVVWGGVLTLTASVTAGSSGAAKGLVSFCDATANNCTDVHVVGSAQLNGAGTAIIKFRPGIGSHSYKAIFSGTNTYAQSSSLTDSVTVTTGGGQYPTAPLLSSTGIWGSYTLTATVEEFGGTAPLTGGISIQDTSQGNAVLATAALGPSTPGLFWAARAPCSNPLGANAIVTADFNGDGYLDLATVYGSTNNVTIYDYQPTLGCYTQSSTYTTGSSPAGIIAADFNSDGIIDLAIPNSGSNGLTILLGHGDGTFTVSSVPIANISTTLIAADFNGDGVADLIAGNYFAGNVTVLLGNGDGTFTTAPGFSTSGPSSVVVGDFNGDGRLDLALAVSGAVDVLFGKGDGTFNTGPLLNVPTSNSTYVWQLATADFNGDGKPDLAVSVGVNQVPTQGQVDFFLGNGDGTFSASGLLTTPNMPVQLKTADFNQDGIADLAELDITGSLMVALGKGDGTFNSPLNAATVDFYQGFALGDVDGDGRPDLIYSGAYPPNRVFIFFGLTKPMETASTAPLPVAPAGIGQHLVVASYAGDATSTSGTSNPVTLLGTPPATTITLALTANGGAASTVSPGTAITLTATVTSNGNPAPRGQVNFCDATAPSCTDIHLLGSAQLTGSGIATLKLIPAPGSYSYKAMLMESAYGAPSQSNAVELTVTAPPPSLLQTTTGIAQAGSPGNYTLTATVVGSGSTTAPTGNVSFVNTSYANSVLATAPLGTPVGGVAFQPPTSLPISTQGSLQMARGDFNGDGIEDIVVVNSNTMAWTILLGKGDGTFTENSGPTLTGYINAVVAGDFNVDGKADLAVTTTGPAYNSPGALLIFLGNGDGTFTAVANAVPTGGNGTVFSATDFDGDGKLDLLVNNGSSSQILPGNGDGTFQTGVTSSAALAVTDLNRDGIPDIVAGQWNGSSAQVMLGKGDGSFSVVGPGLQSGGSEISAGVVTVADLNGDGIPDLAVTGYFYSSPAIYLGKGDGTFTAIAGSSYPQVNNPASIIAVDLNHDGKTDLAIGNGNGYAGNASNPDIAVLLGNGDGTFTSVPGDTHFDGIGMLLSGGFGANGVPEIALVSSAGISLMQCVPTITETATATGVSPGTASPNLVAAIYAGDSTFLPSISPTIPLTAVAATPAIVPASGTYTSLSTITITEATPGATVYYWGTGALATSGYVQYTGPIPIYQNGPATIQAYATGTGFDQSATASASFTFNLPVAAAPTISLPSGQYPTAQTVTITAQSGTTIFYSTSGAGASLSSTPYTGPITVSASETLSAIASGGGYTTSKPGTAQYVITSAPSSFIYTVAGTQNWGYLGDGGQATVASLIAPWGTAIDNVGNLYIADAGSNVVRKVAAGTGVITTVAGTGSRGYSGDGGSATSAQMSYPTGIAVDGSGNLYIADEGNRLVRKVAAGTGVITTFAGNSSATQEGDGGPATSAQLIAPMNVAIDSAGNVYVATDFGRIRKVAAGTGTITTVAGTGTPGYRGDGGPATSAQLNQPYGVAVDSAGNIYIADTMNNLIRKVTANTGIITTVAGAVSPYTGGGLRGYGGDGGPATSAQLGQPYGITVDSAGNLYIADTSNYVIREVTASNGNISTIVGTPFTCTALGGDAGPAFEAGLCNPSSVSLDVNGNLYVAEQGAYRVRKITASALPPTTAASAPVFNVQSGTYNGTQTLTISEPAPGAEIYVTADGSTPVTTGEGYHGPIAITASATIKAIAVAPGLASSSVTSASYTITPSPTALISTAVGGPDRTTLTGPNSVAFDSSGNMYVDDYYAAVVWKVATGTGAISIVAGQRNTFCGTQFGVPATSTCLINPTRIAVDGTGNLFISSSSAVLMVSAQTGLLSVYAGGGSTFTTPFGDGGPATSATLQSAQGLAIDNAGNLYIADSGHGLIRMVSARTGIITTVAGSSAATSLGDGGAATSARLSGPTDIVLDHNGNLYIADLNNYRVRMAASGTGVITTIAGNGLPGDTGDGGSAATAKVAPEGLAVDSIGNLYISNYPDRVREVAAGGNTITTVAGIGYVGYSGDGGAASMAEISNPSGLAFDASGNLYVAALGNAAVRKIRFLTSPSITWATPAAITYGTPLNTAQLNAAANVPGTFVYSPSVGTVLGVGIQTLSVIFTPTDTTNYSTATSSVQLTVNRAVPIITWASPAAIGYGTALTSVQLNASANVPGTFAYTPAAGTVLPPGSNTLSVDFTPNDASDYTSATNQVTIVVNQPVPTITSLSPAIGSAGGAAFTLTVNGAGFTQSSVIKWNSSALSTTYVSGTQLSAQVLTANLASAGQDSITVQNPSPGGGSSNSFQFEVDTAGSGPPVFTTVTANIAAGASANYPVTLPSGATNVSVSCLNLPAGSSCSYSAANSSVSVSTSTTTPTGTYQITVVFTETLPGAATAWLLPIFILPLLIAARRRSFQQLWLAFCLAAVLGFAVSVTGCGGGSGGSSNPVQQTHQATSSSVVTLTVH